jgi:hypothetical protein
MAEIHQRVLYTIPPQAAGSTPTQSGDRYAAFGRVCLPFAEKSLVP